jgi:excisionase family DNA binding protein
MKKDIDELLTVLEVARILRVSRNRAYELVRLGVVPAIRLGRQVRVPRSALERCVFDPARCLGPDGERE